MRKTRNLVLSDNKYYTKHNNILIYLSYSSHSKNNSFMYLNLSTLSLVK